MLHLDKLSLKNFMCCDKAYFDFNNASTIILEGDNGQGKSAVLEAVAVCLAEHKRADSFKDFIQKKHDHSFINLSATYNGEAINFDVKLNNKGGTPLERDVLYKGKHYLNSEVSTLLTDLELNFYSNIIFSMQGDNDVATMSPTQRATLLQKLFQFDFTDKLQSLQDKIDEYAEIKNHNDTQITYLHNSIESKHKSIQKEKQLPFTKDEFDEKDKKSRIFAESLKAYNDGLLGVSSLNKNLTEAITKINSIELNQHDAQKQIDDKARIEAAMKDISEQLNLPCEDYKEILRKTDSEIESLSNDIADSQHTIESLVTEIANIKFEITQNEKQIELGKKGLCPTCGHSTDDIDISALEAANAKASESLDKLLSEQTETRSKIKTLTKRLTDLRSTRNVTVVNMTNRTAKGVSLTQQYDDYKKEYDSLVKGNWEAILTGFNSELKDAKLAKKQIETLIADKEKDISSFKEKQEEYIKLQSDIKSFTDIVMQNQWIKDSNIKIEQEVADLQDKISSLQKISSDVEHNLEYTKEAFHVLDIELPNYLIVKTCAKLEQEMNSFIQVIFPTTRISLRQNRRGVEFFYTTDPTANINNTDELINAKMASGFEKAALSAAFKVALCKAYGLTFAALDEIDSAASDKNSERLFESLISENTFTQLFIITHKIATREIIKNISKDAIAYHVHAGHFTLNEGDEVEE